MNESNDGDTLIRLSTMARSHKVSYSSLYKAVQKSSVEPVTPHRFLYRKSDLLQVLKTINQRKEYRSEHLKSKMPDGYVTVKEAAERLDIDRQKIYLWKSKGLIHSCVNPFGVYLKDVEELAECIGSNGKLDTSKIRSASGGSKWKNRHIIK